jgi:alkyl hydroperoxide reductase subunit AhpC
VPTVHLIRIGEREERRGVMTELVTTGTWLVNADKQDDFIRAWTEFTGWAATLPGASTLRLGRDAGDPRRFVSFGVWAGADAAHEWKSSPEFREGLAQVLQYVDEFHPAELEVLATAGDDSGAHGLLRIGDTAPDFVAETTEGRIGFHDWVGDSWAVLFSHPKDFTPICTTELGRLAMIKSEFDRRGVKLIGLSVDAVSNHESWAQDIEETQGARPNYPIIGDTDLAVSKLYGMLPASEEGDPSRTPADNQTVRNVFVIGPGRKIKLVLVYPMTTGRNFDEVLRAVDSLQLTAKHRVATPVDWRPGEDVVIAGSVSNDEAREIFGDWKEVKPYLRIVPQPVG